MRWASVETTIRTPAIVAARAWAAMRSSRSGCELTSRNVPVSCAVAKTASKSRS